MCAGINLAAFVLWRVDAAFMDRHFVTSLSAVSQGRPYTLLTSAVSQVRLSPGRMWCSRECLFEMAFIIYPMPYV